MKKTISRLFIILTSILVAVLMAIGCVYLISPKNRGESITASAEQHTSDSLYFHEGASAKFEFSDHYYIRFVLYAKTDYLQGLATGTRFFIYEENAAPIYLSTDDYTYTYLPYGEVYGIDKGFFVSSNSSIDIPGMKRIILYVKTFNPYTPIQLNAYEGTLSVEALSDARSVVQVWRSALSNGDPEAEVYRDMIEPFLANQPDGLCFTSKTIVPSSKAMTLDLSMSSEQVSQIRNGKTEMTEAEVDSYLDTDFSWLGVDNYIQYRLEIIRSTSSENYGGIGAGSEDVVFFFSGNDWTLGGDITYCGSYVRASIPLPEDNERTYYYYARIVRKISFDYWLPRVFNVEEFAERSDLVTTSRNVLLLSTKSLASSILENDYDMSEDDRTSLQIIAGIQPSSAEIPVTVNFKKWENDTVSDDSFQIMVPSYWAQNSRLVFGTMISATEYVSADSFNVVFASRYYDEELQQDCYTDRRVVLEADGYTYVYDDEEEKGTLTITYKDFHYSNLRIRIKSNDMESAPYEIDFYPTETRFSDEGTYREIVFPFQDIREQVGNVTYWVFDLDQSDFTITGTTANVTTSFTADGLKVRYKIGCENDLASLLIVAVTEIVEDVEISVTYKYRSADATGATYTETTSEPFTETYSKLARLNFQGFMSRFGTIVNNACMSSVVFGNWLTPNGIKISLNREEETCEIVVEYRQSTVFKITNSKDSSVYYRALNHESILYTGKTFADWIGTPAGYRVEKIESASDYVQIAPSDNPSTLYIRVSSDTYGANEIPIHVVFTDKWNLVINYLVPYKDYRIKSGVAGASPSFAEMRTLEKQIRVSDYPDVYSLTKENVYSIVHAKDAEFSFDILGQSHVSGVKSVEFDGISTYKVNLLYSVATLIAFDYNGGNRFEIQVPLTSYAEWCDMYGQDWTIKYLNTDQRKYFKYADDIDRDKLYGFFTVAVFEEHVSDLNYYFQKEGSDGVVSIYESKEVKGSKIYKFFGEKSENVLGGLLGTPIGMAFCELVNSDNYLCYSYFMYLDCTSDVPFYGRNGADNAYDNDSAIKNQVEDIGDWVVEKFSNLWNWGPIQVLKWILFVIAGIFVIGLIIRAVVWAFNGTKKSNSSGKRKR